MAATAAGAALTERHRATQLRLRAVTLRQLLALWPIWRPEDLTSFDRFVTATVPLVQLRRRDSAGLASAYYQAFRLAEGASGQATPRLAAEVDTDRVVTSLQVTGRAMTFKALQAGLGAAQAQQQALVRVSGAVSRHVLDGARDTVIDSTEADRQALGYQRVTSGDACAFCAMLASRGPVYKAETVGFRSHDHCSCASEPVYRGSNLPDSSQRYRDLWNAHAKGSDDPLNTFRRALAAT